MADCTKKLSFIWCSIRRRHCRAEHLSETVYRSLLWVNFGWSACIPGAFMGLGWYSWVIIGPALPPGSHGEETEKCLPPPYAAMGWGEGGGRKGALPWYMAPHNPYNSSFSCGKAESALTRGSGGEVGEGSSPASWLPSLQLPWLGYWGELGQACAIMWVHFPTPLPQSLDSSSMQLCQSWSWGESGGKEHPPHYIGLTCLPLLGL